MFRSPTKVSADEELSALSPAEIRLLLFKGVDDGRLDIVHRVLTASPELRRAVDDEGSSLLHRAVRSSQVDVLRSLLRSGVPADALRAQKTALHVALETTGLARRDALCDAFSAELLQSVMVDDPEKTTELLRAGVSPHARVGKDTKHLLALAEDLLAARASTNEAFAVLQKAAAANEALKTANSAEAEGTLHAVRVGVVESRVLQPEQDTHATDLGTRLEEQEAVIARLKSMLQEMAEEQTVLQRLVRKQGSVSIADHFRELKHRIAEVHQRPCLRCDDRGAK